MRIEIVRNHPPKIVPDPRITGREVSTLEERRETWTFQLIENEYTSNPPTFQLEYYNQSTKLSRQKLWRGCLCWQRIDKRHNKIEKPPLPEDVVEEAKAFVKAEIDKITVNGIIT